jgi:hypothetical protein
MKFKILTIALAALTFSACNGGAANTANTLANKAGNAVNTVANTASNAANSVVNTNATTGATNTNSASNSTGSDAGGQVIKIDEAGIQMTVPAGFKFSKDGEDTVVKTDDEGVEVRFTVPKDGDYGKAITDAAEELDSYLKDVKIDDKGSKTDVNGMDATEMNGSAKDKAGETVMWDLTVINAPKKPVLANIYAEKPSLDKHAAEVKTFLKSVKKQ